jgi:hypothetical protein
VTPHEHLCVDDKILAEETHEPTLPDQEPRSHANCLREEANRL